MKNQFDCDLCGLIFSKKYNLQRHRISCDGFLPLQCRGCGVLFKTKQAKYKHTQKKNCHKPPLLNNVVRPPPLPTSSRPQVLLPQPLPTPMPPQLPASAPPQLPASDVVAVTEHEKVPIIVGSIKNAGIPPKTAGVYLTNCSNPDTTKFVFHNIIPEGKNAIAFGYSGKNMFFRVEKQVAETGDYKFLDCIETSHASVLEESLKDYLKVQGLRTIKGTYTEPCGKKHTKTEFFLADAEEYMALHAYLLKCVTDLESSRDDSVIRSHELALAEHATRQAEAHARAEIEKTKQMEEKTKHQVHDLEFLRLKISN